MNHRIASEDHCESLSNAPGILSHKQPRLAP